MEIFERCYTSPLPPHNCISQIWLTCISQGWLFGLGWGVVLYSKLLRQTIVYEWIVQCAFWPRLAVHVELARNGLYYITEGAIFIYFQWKIRSDRGVLFIYLLLCII